MGEIDRVGRWKQNTPGERWKKRKVGELVRKMLRENPKKEVEGKWKK